MSRLIDRIRAEGSAPFRPFHLAANAPGIEFWEAQARDLADPRVTAEQLQAAAKRTRYWENGGPTSTDRLDPSTLDNVPVIAGDAVARFCAQFLERDMSEIVTTLAPPFDRFWVDIQGAPNTIGVRAWGVLVENITDSVGGDWNRDHIGWHLQLTLFIERDKGTPIGPVAMYVLALDPEGLWERNDQGVPTFAGRLPDFDPPPPPEVVSHTLDGLNSLVFPALMTLSFMHCRNVSAREVSPPPALAKKWGKRRGTGLTRYYVLDIAPMRRVLDNEGYAQSRGLSEALHICRGHFKTFTEDAPLFGRVTGTFWWAPHVRGDLALGEIVKDYRVRLEDDAAVGAPYVQADENPTVAPSQASGPEPDSSGRSYAAHNRTQNLLAAAVRRRELEPLRPEGDDPRFDLAFRSADGQLVVCEVKSLTDANEERQLRIALGQVVRYRHQLAHGTAMPQGLIAVERQPSDASWLDTCNASGVILTWPETFDLAIGAITQRN